MAEYLSSLSVCMSVSECLAQMMIWMGGVYMCVRSGTLPLVVFISPLSPTLSPVWCCVVLFNLFFFVPFILIFSFSSFSALSLSFHSVCHHPSFPFPQIHCFHYISSPSTSNNTHSFSPPPLSLSNSTTLLSQTHSQWTPTRSRPQWATTCCRVG